MQATSKSSFVKFLLLVHLIFEMMQNCQTFQQLQPIKSKKQYANKHSDKCRAKNAKKSI